MTAVQDIEIEIDIDLDLDLDLEIDIEELGSRIIGTAGRLAAATCRWLLLIAEFDAREGFARFGLPSTGRWLAHYCGLSRRTAFEHVRVARALAAYPALVAGMGAGRLSFSHVRAISRMAGLGTPELIDELIMVAEHGTVRQVEDLVRGLRTVDDNNRDDPERAPERLTRRWRSTSRFGLSATLDPENGVLVQSAIEAVARREGITQAQALTRLAEITLAVLHAAGDAPAPRLRGDEHAAVVIHLAAAAERSAEHQTAEPRDAAAAETDVELERLAAVVAELAGPPTRAQRRSDRRRAAQRQRSREHSPRPFARIVRGPGLPAEVVERLACAGRVRLITFDPRIPPGGEVPSPLDVGQSRRLVSDRQFRALQARDGGCAHPGCGSRLGLEAHHVLHWMHGGRTVLANLVLLCRKHHHAHHAGEFSIVALGRGRFRFTSVEGTELPAHVDPSPHITDHTNIEDAHAEVTADAATTRWDGSRLDHDYAVAALARRLDSTELARQRVAQRQQAWAGHDPWAAPQATTAAAA